MLLSYFNPGNQFIYYYSASSENVQKELKGKFWGTGKIIDVDMEHRKNIVEYEEFGNKVTKELFYEHLPDEYKPFYERNNNGRKEIQIGIKGTILIDEFQFNLIQGTCRI